VCYWPEDTTTEETQMEALLDVVKDYNYKGPSQHKYGGIQHKLIFITLNANGEKETWSCQISPKMKNYVKWVDIIQRHKANPGYYQEVFDLVPWARKPFCFDADIQPRAGKLHIKKKPPAPKVDHNQYDKLFDNQG